MKMITCFFLLLFTAGCVTTPIDEQLETNKADNAELWPYMDWRTNSYEKRAELPEVDAENVRYKEYLDSKSSGVTVRPSGTLYKHGDGWFLEDIKIQLQDMK